MFKKDKSRVESINDLDNLLINFYEVLKDKEMSKELFKMAELSLNSESLQNYYGKETMKYRLKTIPKIQRVELAYYYYYTTIYGFNGQTDQIGYGYLKNINTGNVNSRRFLNKVFNINNFHLRLKHVQIFCRDALKVIKNLDTPGTFFYLDPPYPGANQKYAIKYSDEEFNNLIDLLKSIKGKFLLSFYRQDFMKFPKDWVLSYKKATSVANKALKYDRRRIETLARNYGI